MFATPGTPNVADYVAFLAGVAGIPPAATPGVFPTASGTATDGDNGSLVDTEQEWTPQQWVNYFVVDVTQGETAQIIGNDEDSVVFTVAVPNSVMPGDSYVIVSDIVLTSFDIARDIVNDTLQVAPRIYTLAVYNLATDRLINFANDVPGQTFFQDLRKLFRISDVSVGVPSSANDAGTGVGILNPEQLKMLTIQDLQTMKTSFGRTYMGFAQSYGQTIWGLS